jgi:hypothetical protein
MTRTILRDLAVAGAIVLSTAAISPAADTRVFGGFSLDPDQFDGGFQFRTSRNVEGFSFRPMVDVGLGDDRTRIGVGGHFVVSSSSNAGKFRPYFGLGPALQIFSSDRGNDGAEAGIDFIVGLRHRGGFFMEGLVGALDSPSFRLVVGFSLN